MSLVDIGALVDPMCQRVFLYTAEVLAQYHRPSQVGDTFKFSPLEKNLMVGIFSKFSTVGAFELGDIARKFDGGTLHSQTYAKKRYLLLAGIGHSIDLTFDAADSKSPRDQDPVGCL